jgi:hypothetical protein
MGLSAEKGPGRPSRKGRGATVGSDPFSKITLTVTDAQRFLGRSKRAFYLLRRDPTEDSAPFSSRADHWLMRDLLEWIESRRRRDAIPGRTALSSTDRSSVLAAPDA